MSFSNISETDMTFAQPYYYREPEFQLELNLQVLRLAIIMWLDALSECDVCNRSECCCEDTISTIVNSSSESSSASKLDFSTSTETIVDEHHFIPAPHPGALPTPRWKLLVPCSSTPIVEDIQDIEDWVRASFPDFRLNLNMLYPINVNINNAVNTSWPPLPNSIWNNDPVQSQQVAPVPAWPPALPQRAAPSLTPAVEAFFRYCSQFAFYGYTY